MPAAARRSLLTLARVGVAGLGVALLVITARQVGVDTLRGLAIGAAPWLPLAALLDLGRIAMDAMATRAVLGPRGQVVPPSTLLAAHLAAHGVMNVFPAGRSSSEVVKAALLEPHVGVAPAAATGATNQANVLVSSALFSIPCAVGAAWTAREPALVGAIAIHAVVLLAAGVGLRVLVTHPWIEGALRARTPALAARLAGFHAASRETPLLAWSAVAWMMLGRALQTLEYAVLARAVGIRVGPAGALAVQGTNLVAAALGVLVPGQVGSAEAVFALAATALGTTPAQATSVALLAHALSLGWVAIGLAVLLLWRARRNVGTA